MMHSRAKNFWVFADIDDNLITTVRTSPEPGARECSWDADGRVCGYLTAKQAAVLELLRSGTNVVPTTARSSLERLAIELNGYAIVANGGIILGADGRPIRQYYDLIKDHSHRDGQLMQAEAASVIAEAGSQQINARVKVVSAAGLDLFVTVKHNEKKCEELAPLAAALKTRAPQGWQVHSNGNAVFLLPAWLGKANAVAWMKQNIIPDCAVTIGMGDSNSDVPFMDLCDYVLMPRSAQNWSALVQALSKGDS